MTVNNYHSGSYTLSEKSGMSEGDRAAYGLLKLYMLVICLNYFIDWLQTI